MPLFQVLWHTLCDPDPQTNGQFIYSGGLIRAVANSGARLTVLGLSRQPGAARGRKEPNIDWHFAENRHASRWVRVASRFPALAQRTRVPELRAALARHLAQGKWDALVLDSFNVTWALPHFLRYRRRHRQTKIVYVAENHETTAARALVHAESGLRRAYRLAEVAKTEWLERRLVQMADLVTADAPEDCRALEVMCPGKSVVFLPPGYSGLRATARTIDSRVPRRAVVVGSFDWLAKRLSLESFLTVAAPLFAANGISLQIVGRTEDSYVRTLRQRFPSVEVLGTVPDVHPYIAQARIALVPDVLGGFKLKSLDYIFGRRPIFGMEGAVPGTPLSEGRGIRLFNSHVALARAVADTIDDIASLNELQETAHALSVDRFDWDAIGHNLIQRIRNADSPLPATIQSLHKVEVD